MDEVLNKIFNEDCLIGMDRIPDKSIDAIICDLPYNLFEKYEESAWDQLIPMDKLWAQYKRIRKDDCPILLFGTEPFSSHIRLSNESEFRYDYVWKKKNPTGFTFCKFQPLRQHEMISVFYKKNRPLNQQNLIKLEKPVKAGRKNKTFPGGVNAETTRLLDKNKMSYFTGYQRSILDIDNWAEHGTKREFRHPTQKPVDLIRYLIRTYSNEGDIILDNCMGSGTSAIAAMRENRNFIGFELDPGFYATCIRRIEAEKENQEIEKKNTENQLF